MSEPFVKYHLMHGEKIKYHYALSADLLDELWDRLNEKKAQIAKQYDIDPDELEWVREH